MFSAWRTHTTATQDMGSSLLEFLGDVYGFIAWMLFLHPG
jgi:hypothetical protein